MYAVWSGSLPFSPIKENSTEPQAKKLPLASVSVAILFLKGPVLSVVQQLAVQMKHACKDKEENLHIYLPELSAKRKKAAAVT